MRQGIGGAYRAAGRLASPGDVRIFRAGEEMRRSFLRSVLVCVVMSGATSPALASRRLQTDIGGVSGDCDSVSMSAAWPAQGAQSALRYTVTDGENGASWDAVVAVEPGEVFHRIALAPLVRDPGRRTIRLDARLVDASGNVLLSDSETEPLPCGLPPGG
jgi:hypothetical protein